MSDHEKELTEEEMTNAAGGKQLRRAAAPDSDVAAFKTQRADEPDSGDRDVRRKIRRADPPQTR